MLDGADGFLIRVPYGVHPTVRRYVVSDLEGTVLFQARRADPSLLAVPVMAGAPLLSVFIYKGLPPEAFKVLFPVIVLATMLTVICAFLWKTPLVVTSLREGGERLFSMIPERRHLPFRNSYRVVDQAGAQIGSVALTRGIKGLFGVWEVRDAAGKTVLTTALKPFSLRTNYTLMAKEGGNEFGRITSDLFQNKYTVSLNERHCGPADRRLVLGLALVVANLRRSRYGRA